jgi:enoyl-CoA hydratase
MSVCVHVTIKDGIYELVLDNPGRKNALSLSLLDALKEALARARNDNARSVILTGAGDTFSAGADLTDIIGTIDDIVVDEAIEQAVHEIQSLPAPIIVAIEGPCVGGAVELALAGDALVVSDDAYFQIPATQLGLLYNPKAVMRMRARLSWATLGRLLLFGEQLNAETAFRAGLVSCVVAAGGARDKAWELGRCALMGEAHAVAATKELLVALDRGETELGRWDQIRAEILSSAERREAVSRAKKRLGRR